MVTLLGTVRLVRPVQSEISSVVSAVQAERSRLLRPEPETFSVVTLLGRVNPVKPVQPETSNVDNDEYPDRSRTSVTLEQLLAFSVVTLPRLAPNRFSVPVICLFCSNV